jgi:mannose-6-phosphate isomerase-like protein (cupin superfamily)
MIDIAGAELALSEIDLPHSTRVNFDAGPADIAALNRLVRAGSRPLNEHFADDLHLNEVIPKPWGYEYRAYVDDFFDFWALHIESSHATSMHVHPRKLTYLLCLGGSGVTAGLRGEAHVSAGTILRIAPGAFHATRNVSDEPLELIEVEAPRNKFDLMRLQDDYNRAGTAYESGSRMIPKHPMKRVPYMPNGKMRASTPDGRYKFNIRTGMDIFYRRRFEDLFYVPLDISGMIYSKVSILTNDSADGRRPELEEKYLCISRVF